MTEFVIPNDMPTIEVEMKLLQSLDIIAQLTENNTAEARNMALKFLSDFQPKDLSYDGSFLTGSQDELLF